ncbi:MAG: right-handed parallel beta-helix repeat-containing protein [Planctomycetota bacterium]|jgi:hypothetical protein
MCIHLARGLPRALAAAAPILASVALLPAQTTRVVPSATYPTIQAAIDACTAGDTVSVQPGSYKERIDFKGKNIAVKSQLGYIYTFLDGNLGGPVVAFTSGEGRTAVLEGFTVERGKTTGAKQDGAGIRIVGSSPTIRLCRVRNNTATDSGAGIGGHNGGAKARPTSPLIEDCIIERNTCTLVDLTAISGGGGIGLREFKAGGRPVIRRCIIRDNQAGASGGGIFILMAAEATVEECIVARNKTTGTKIPAGGGGINITETAGRIWNCRVYDNVSAHDGGGLKVRGVSGFWAVNNTFVNNAGGCMAVHSWYSLQATILCYNNICWQNGTKEFSVSGSPNPWIWVESCALTPGTTGSSSVVIVKGLFKDPLLANARTWAHHLRPGSPCIDAGKDLAPLPKPVVDMDRGPRTVNGKVDIGADEYDPAAMLLWHDRGPISIKSPGKAKFTLYGGAGRQKDAYLIVLGVSGVYPGMNLAGFYLPMNLDVLWPLSSGMPGFVGVLDSQAQATATVDLAPAKNDTSLIGFEVYFCSTVTKGGIILGFSNAVSLELTP